MPLAAPVTIATLSLSFLSITSLLSQNDADAPLGTETFAVQQAALFLDPERTVAGYQTIPVAAEIGVGHAILGAIGDEGRADLQIVADMFSDADVADEVSRPRMRELGMRGSLP